MPKTGQFFTFACSNTEIVEIIESQVHIVKLSPSSFPKS